MSNLKMVLLGLAGVATATALIYRSFRSTTPRHSVVSILQQLNRDSYQLMNQISQMAREMINQKKLYPEEVKTIIQQANSPVSRVLRELEKKTYDSHHVKQEDFAYAVERVYNNDPEVKYLQKLFTQTYEKAMLGVTPVVFIRSPIFMTYEKTLGIVKKVLDEQLRLLKTELEGLRIVTQLKDLKKSIQVQLSQFKKQTMVQEKLNELPDNPVQILQFTIKVCSKHPVFSAKYNNLCKQYEARTKTLISRHLGMLTL